MLSIIDDADPFEHYPEWPDDGFTGWSMLVSHIVEIDPEHRIEFTLRARIDWWDRLWIMHDDGFIIDEEEIDDFLANCVSERMASTGVIRSTYDATPFIKKYLNLKHKRRRHVA